MAESSAYLHPPVCVNEGTRLILVGKTGSGKSSLGNILLQKKDVKMKKAKAASAAKGENIGAQKRETETATSLNTECQGLGTPAASTSEREAQGQETASVPDDGTGFVVAHSTSSGTKTCCYKETARAWGRYLKVVDTPGLCDTAVDIRMTLIELTNVMSLSVPGPHAILFVTRLDVRFTKEEDEAFQKILQMFELNQKELTEKKNIPEQANLQNFLFLVFTHGENLDDDETLEEYLEDAPESLQKIRKFVGDNYAVISKTDNPEKRRREVEDLLAKTDRASQGGDVFYTNELLQKMTKLLNEEIENVMKERKFS